MHKKAKIYVAGHRGLVGSAIVKQLILHGYSNICTRTHLELDLTQQTATEDFFQAEKPDYVFLAAAKVGGILANQIYPAEFAYENLTIQTNVIHAAWKNNIKRLLFLGSSCIYPKHAPQPMREEYLLTGALEPTNRPYALAKIAGIEMCSSYNRQYGSQYLAVMPTNLYGPGDNYHLDNSHVIPALIRKFHEAKMQNAPEIVIWGTGTAKREFLYSEDMAHACVYLMNLPDTIFNDLLSSNALIPPIINLGVGKDQSIGELATLIKSIIGFKGALNFDHSKPDGTPRKLLDVSRLQSLGWQATTSLEAGLQKTYDDFFCLI